MGIEEMVLQDCRESIRADAGQEGDDEACKEGESKIGTSDSQAGEKEIETSLMGLWPSSSRPRSPRVESWNQGRDPLIVLSDLMCLFYRLYQEALLVSNSSSPLYVSTFSHH